VPWDASGLGPAAYGEIPLVREAVSGFFVAVKGLHADGPMDLFEDFGHVADAVGNARVPQTFDFQVQLAKAFVDEHKVARVVFRGSVDARFVHVQKDDGASQRGFHQRAMVVKSKVPFQPNNLYSHKR
jgi:hypothetical protein